MCLWNTPNIFGIGNLNGDSFSRRQFTGGRDASFHSGWWSFVAEAVAHYKKVPIADVARAASDNTLQLYPQLRLQSSDETQNNSPVLEECQEAETTSDA
jgi:hypothetical protein